MKTQLKAYAAQLQQHETATKEFVAWLEKQSEEMLQPIDSNTNLTSLLSELEDFCQWHSHMFDDMHGCRFSTDSRIENIVCELTRFGDALQLVTSPRKERQIEIPF